MFVFRPARNGSNKNMDQTAMNYATTFAALILLAVPAFAQERSAKPVELRVDTSLFIADQSAPVSHNVTFFTDGHVYDFGKTSEKDAATEITVYDFRTRTFTLLEDKRKVKFSISQSRLVQLTEAMRAETAQDPKLKIFATAEYTETADNASGSVSYTHLTLPTTPYV